MDWDASAPKELTATSSPTTTSSSVNSVMPAMDKGSDGLLGGDCDADLFVGDGAGCWSPRHGSYGILSTGGFELGNASFKLGAGYIL